MSVSFGSVLRDSNFIDAAYLLAAVCFIISLRQLSHPSTARVGNRVAMFGMLVAVVATLLDRSITNYIWIVVGIAIGTLVGAYSARAVKMTAMPQMVALFNGVGGGAVALVAISEWHRLAPEGARIPLETSIPIVLGCIIGSISFAGSVIAFLKLQEWMTGRPITFGAQQAVNGAIFAALAAMAVILLVGTESVPLFAVMLVVALVFGVMMVLPIGGADMPVVISLLNAFTGLSAALAGFELDNTVLIISGTLVGASGTLLTLMMGRAMNRSVANVLFGAFGAVPEGGAAAAGAGANGDRPVRSGQPVDAAILMSYARSVVIVPGYGLAVAQAQHDVRELADVLEKRGIAVKYAIHPVAGRMPGHMNVLLAEADVPYDELYEMDEINPEFPRTDVALVIGANDVTNPAAQNSPDSPIYGMPILEVDKAENVIVLKRSMNPGFAGIDNELYYEPQTMMVFGDAKDTVKKLVQEVQNV